MSQADLFWLPSNVRRAARGRWIRRPLDQTRPEPQLAGVTTDSRAVRPGQAFIALRGEKFDGHDFLLDAAKSGAAMLVVDRPLPSSFAAAWPGDLYVAQVEDTLKSLAHLAAAYRSALANTRFIAVTGSNGKTTTKQLLVSVLSQAMRGSGSVKSFNNHIGVPLTILSAKPGDQFLVSEIGTSGPGEIARLSAIVRPHVGVITSIGRVHLEGLGSIEGVAREKATLLDHLDPDSGWAAITADAPALRAHKHRMKSGITFGFAAGADLRIIDAALTSAGTIFMLNDRTRWTVPLMGIHHAGNAAAAIAVGRRLGLPDAQIAAGLAKVEAPDMRFTRQTIGDWIVYNDAYNANPESMAAAIRTFASATLDAPRRVVVLGDMLELGPEAAPIHREIGRCVIEADRAAPFGLGAFIGAGMACAAEEVRRAWGDERVLHFAAEDMDRGRAAEVIRERLRPGDRILVKASRGLALERVVESLRHHVAATQAAPPVVCARAIPADAVASGRSTG